MNTETPSGGDPARIAVTVVAGGGLDPISEVARALMRLDGDRAVLVTPGFAEPSPWEEIEAEEEVVAFDPECVCCALRFDLVRVVSALASRRHPPERIVVATLPDSDVALLVGTFLRSGRLARRCYVDGIVVLDDGDAAGERALARRLLADAGSTDPGRALGARSWDLGTVAARLASPAHVRGQHSIELAVDAELDIDHLLEWIETVQDDHGPSILRVEGDLAVAGEPRRWLLQGIRRTLEIDDGAVHSGESSRLRIVGIDLPAERLAKGFSRTAVS